MGYWDQFAGKYSFNAPGDTIAGTVTDLKVAKFTSGDVPEIHIRTDNGMERWVVASQTVLTSKLAEVTPDVGDWIKITYTGESDKKLPGMSPAKLFTVEVQRKGTRPAPAPVPAAANSSDEPF